MTADMDSLEALEESSGTTTPSTNDDTFYDTFDQSPLRSPDDAPLPLQVPRQMYPRISGFGLDTSNRTDSSDGEYMGWSFRSRKKEHAQRISNSLLKGAVDLRHKGNTIEAPETDSWTVDVDGRTVTFALMNNVTKPPKISRSQRVPIRKMNNNVNGSRKKPWLGHKIQRFLAEYIKIPTLTIVHLIPFFSVQGDTLQSRKRRLERKIQMWLTQRDIPTLTIIYLSCFLIINTIFATLWWLNEGGCCSEHDMTFAQTFDFAVQTSSTIGYGKYHPEGYYNNGLVVLLMSSSICLHTVYGGLLFFKFITPSANIAFSEVITMCNVMGHQCLEIRVGNTDGDSNNLINAEANLCMTSIQEYKSPHEYETRHTEQTEDLKLAVSQKHKLDDVWTLRHFIDEKSPLYGMRFDEFPGTTIKAVELNVKAVHGITKGTINSQATYQVQDILVGWRFEKLYSWDPESQTEHYDYSKLSSVKPSTVWYPKGIADIHHC